MSIAERELAILRYSGHEKINRSGNCRLSYIRERVRYFVHRNILIFSRMYMQDTGRKQRNRIYDEVD